MANEIVIVGENMMMRPKWFLKICLRNHYHEQCQAIPINIIMEWMSPPLPPQLLLTTLYIYFVKN
jgi:hypothetical protein